MKKIIIILGLFSFSCSPDGPSAIKDRVFLDTTETEDTVYIQPEVILPEDKTEVADSVKIDSSKIIR